MSKPEDDIKLAQLAASGWPDIWCAASLGDVALLVTLLARGADPNAIGGQTTSAMHIAAINGHLDAIRALLAYGANPNAVDSHGNGALWAAVHQACLGSRTESNLSIVSILLAGGADPDHINRHGRSPRDMALQRDKVVSLLFLNHAPKE